ncbi:MAG: c-type cytochrome [Deltaproteobacteria bacterium]|nr:c-type cytochrome [Deltaproteobacteria bacterium]
MGSGVRRMAAAAMIGGVALALAACRPPAPKAPPRSGAPIADWSVARGAVLYASYCGGCHGPSGRGDGPVAGVIDLRPADLRAPGLLDRNSDDELVARLLHGTPLPSTPRRNAVAEDLETDAITAYLPTLSHADWGRLRAGRFVFEGACAPCHGAYGQGEGVLGATNEPPPPNLMVARARHGDRALERIAVEGIGTMPPLADTFEPGELRALVAYVRHLSKGYRLYDTYCAACHGDDGRGVHPEDLLPPATKAPVIGAETAQRLGPAATRTRVLHMLRRESGRMPHFQDTLTDVQLRDVLAYLRHESR